MGLFDKLKKNGNKHIINNKTVILTYNKELEKVVKIFVNILEEEDKINNIIKENSTLKIGYLLYKIILEKEDYRLLAIDLKNKELNTFTDDLNLALNYFNRQANIINLTKIKNQVTDTYYDDDMIISKQSLKSNKLYMLREQRKDKDCGWYLGAVGEEKTNNPSDYMKIKTYRLKDICDVAIDVLQLPAGTLAIIENNKIIDLVDKNNNKLL
ncbi:MAG: hypothetical protein ACI4UE_00900 [Candidatus Scatovivens sp.]